MAQDLPPSGGYEPIQYKVSLSSRQSVLPTRPRTISLPVSNAPNPFPFCSDTTTKQQQRQTSKETSPPKKRERPHTTLHTYMIKKKH